jgi:hypothetical protein
VWPPGEFVPTTAQDVLPVGNNATDPGIGMGADKTRSGQLQGRGHALVIEA